MPLSGYREFELVLVLLAGNEMIKKKDIRFGKFSPIGRELTKSFYISEGYAVASKDHRLTVKGVSYGEQIGMYFAFLRQLSASEILGARMASVTSSSPM